MNYTTTMRMPKPIALLVLLLVSPPSMASSASATATTTTAAHFDGNTDDYLCFETRSELDQAVQDYLGTDDVPRKQEVTLLYGPIRNWCVDQITDFDFLFAYATDFNEPLDGWNMSAATDLQGMFFHATAFNQDLSAWDVSHVTNMHGMFAFATTFDQNVQAWDTSAVTSMHSMFLGATQFGGSDSRSSSSNTNCHALTTWDTRSLQETDMMLRGTRCTAQDDLLFMLGEEAFVSSSHKVD
mmetsp:Transcript_1859/g.4083  ORF Transcript_1859/g.4083 Transcript_1859/m.4083 type:complete len:241 (+) Transcript_1859:266-988(+)